MYKFAFLKDYYHILQVSRTADAAAIRKAWLKRARECHPDHHPDDPLAEEQFKEVQEAWSVLRDPQSKARYDFQPAFSGPPPATHPVKHYFYCTCRTSAIRCFEEMEVTFTFSGNGRVFRKPPFSGFHITGSPFVAISYVIHEGMQVKETRLTYVIAPIVACRLTIGAASIMVDDKILYTEPIVIDAAAVPCFFIKDTIANGKPMRFTLHYEFPDGEEPLRISELKKNHVILIPRSKAAALFHKIGAIMKWVFTLSGMILFNKYLGWNLIAGGLAGNIIGGMNVHIMYLLAGVAPSYPKSLQFPLVKRYLDNGYRMGESHGIPLIKGNYLFRLGQLLT
ncbi:MAG: DnaJ domain-containing protein [Bacteroidetes bacterium]|nr:DnaJ domain-containing protein [Bacteroidota bacterium]